jgi:hypothetical protein
MSSGVRAAPGVIAFFGGMTKVVAQAPGVEGGRLSLSNTFSLHCLIASLCRSHAVHPFHCD